MVKFLKEVFSRENIQKALLLSSASLNPNMTTRQCLMITECIRAIE